jgi:hypothetical protein
MISISKKLTGSAQVVRVSADWIANGHWAIAVSELRPGWDSNIDVEVEPMPKKETEVIASILSNADYRDLTRYVASPWINDEVKDRPARILAPERGTGEHVPIMIDYWRGLARKGSIAWVKSPLEPIYLTHEIKAFDAAQVYAIVMPMTVSTKVPT